MDKYEKKYNEALERAKKNWELSNCPSRAMLEEVFPELRESEDERMIKWIIKVLDEGYKAFFEMDYSKEDVLSWLKKQKEQKCSECSKHLEGYINGRVDAEKKLLEQFGAVITPEDELHMKPRWKPSEEQMKALQKAVALTACDKELARLYNQLKKL